MGGVALAQRDQIILLRLSLQPSSTSILQTAAVYHKTDWMEHGLFRPAHSHLGTSTESGSVDDGPAA